ncbi:MAG: putative transposase [Leptospirillum sp. Group IV 'UBA BS']|nr:MAG: putative transposase [Leptospirillum sp. Group IV 'UBA BS']
MRPNRCPSLPVAGRFGLPSRFGLPFTAGTFPEASHLGVTPHACSGRFGWLNSRSIAGQFTDATSCRTLYDLSNTYLEGAAERNPLAKRGHSKEKRSDCPLIGLSLVVDRRGFPIASRIVAGNQSEPETLPVALDRLETLAGLNAFPNGPKPTLVMDRGIATRDNIALLKNRGFSYCVVERRPVEKEYADLFASAKETFEWFAPHPERPLEGVYLHKEDLPEEKSSRLLVLSAARKAKEDAMDALKETRFGEALENLKGAIEKGACVRPDTVSRRIGKILARFPSVAKYYTVTPVIEEIPPPSEKAKTEKPGKKTGPTRRKLPPKAPAQKVVGLSWALNVRREERSLLTGTYVIETSHTDLTSRDIWSLYTTLTRVEGAFRDLKSDLGLRPVFHQKADRCMGHLFVSVLAYFLLSTLEHRLREAGETRSWPTVREVLGTLCRTTVTGRDPHTGFDYRIRMTSKPEPEHRGILDKLGIRGFLRRLVSRIRPEKKESQETTSGSST